MYIYIIELQANEKHASRIPGSGALSGKMLLVRIIENNKVDAYFRVG